ncbi:MAG: hypothetical protein AAB510_01940 [Patescibacteria group bacterium]
MEKFINWILILVLLVVPQVGFTAECAPAPVSIISDSSITVEGGGTAVPTHTSVLWTTISGAIWIWDTEFVSNPNINEEVTFVKSFEVANTVHNANLEIAGDDFYEVTLNGSIVASEYGEGNFAAIKTFNLNSNIQSGTNTLKIKIINAKYFFDGQGTSTNNPGGVIFKVTVDAEDCSNSSNGGGSSGGNSSGSKMKDTNGGNDTNTTGGASNTPSNSLAKPTNPLISTIAAFTADNNTPIDGEVLGAEDLMDKMDVMGKDEPLTALALPGFSILGEVYCSLIALAILLILYIIGRLIFTNDEDYKKRIQLIITGSLITIIFLFLFNYTCLLIPLIVLCVILCGLIYTKKI